MQNENQPPSLPSRQSEPSTVFVSEKSPWWKTILRKIWPTGAGMLHKGIVIGAAIVCVLTVSLAVFAMIRTDTPAPAQTAEQPRENPGNSSSSIPSEDVPSPDQAKPEEKKNEAKPPSPSGNDTQAPGGSTPSPSTGGGGTGGGGAPSGSGCALPAYPNETCTGVKAGITLQQHSGDFFINTDGYVLENKQINGCIEVTAANVTIRNTKVICQNNYGIASYGSGDDGGLLVEDVEIDCNHTNTTAISYSGLTARRLHIHGCENGLSIDHSVTLTDSYIHDIYEGATGHGDGIQASNGSNTLIEHNTIYSESTNSSININNNAAGPTTSNMTISNNLIAGGSYTLYCPIPSSVNFKIINNHFSRIFYPNAGAFGPHTACSDEAVISGNTWHDTGVAVPF